MPPQPRIRKERALTEQLAEEVPALPPIVDPELGDEPRRRRVTLFLPQKKIRAWSLKCACNPAGRLVLPPKTVRVRGIPVRLKLAVQLYLLLRERHQLSVSTGWNRAGMSSVGVRLAGLPETWVCFEQNKGKQAGAKNAK